MLNLLLCCVLYVTTSVSIFFIVFPCIPSSVLSQFEVSTSVVFLISVQIAVCKSSVKGGQLQTVFAVP
jgi:hypothetical protein